MTHIIAVTNQKGGVAKTTTTVNLAAAMARRGLSTLLVDMDPQGNASVSSGVNIRELEAGSYDVLIGETSVKDAIVASTNGYDVLPANDDLAGAQVDLMEFDDANLRLKKALKNVQSQYDLIVIDTPPSLNVLTINALAAAPKVLLPVQCEYFALEGVNSLLTTLAMVKKALNPQLEILGVVRTLYDGRTGLAVEVTKDLMKHFREKLCETLIPRNIRLAEAPGHGVSIFEYSPRCRGALAYKALAEELSTRLQIDN